MKEVLVFVFIVYASQHYAKAGHTDLCRHFKDGTQFRRPDTCNEYITCRNETGEIYSCASPKIYDHNKKTCIDTLSDCSANYCEGVNGKWVANPNNCDGYFYCANSVAYPGHCHPGYHFDESKQLCVFDTTSGCEEVPNICYFLPDKTTFRDENDCTKYYECSNGKKSSKSCKNTYFDVEKGACVDKSLVQCTKHPLPKSVCGTEKKPKSGFKSDEATCRGYFNCRNLGSVPDLEPTWAQCPEGQFFNTKTSSCDYPKNTICTYNRCEGRTETLVVSSNNNCRNYIVCENGIEVEERSCSGDKFFDEDMKACVNYATYYPCCDGQK